MRPQKVAFSQVVKCLLTQKKTANGQNMLDMYLDGIRNNQKHDGRQTSVSPIVSLGSAVDADKDT